MSMFDVGLRTRVCARPAVEAGTVDTFGVFKTAAVTC